MSQSTQRGGVLAVLVATDGADTLERTLASLEAQDVDDLRVVAVDNASVDGSRTMLIDALGPEHVFVADRDLGFGGAVAMALDAEASRGAGYVLFVHDDLELRPDAVSKLVAAMDADDELAVVGCKLVDWDDDRRLQAVGMSVDVTGRADPGIEPDEVDQGQRDHEDRTLYVSTAGMLVRRDRFEELGRFDHRYHLFRDDLDLCWRAWLRGWSVEVVPTAVAQHEASASTYRRLGQTATLGPRYFAERNTLATLLKNYGLPRLLLVIPLFALVGVAKVAGFVATRRLGDAWQTVRAWVWNLLHLRETWRLRRTVQRTRERGDAEIAPLFARVTARLRAYAEAFGEVLSGGNDEISLMEEDGPPVPEPTMGERIGRTLRTSPVGVAAIVLLVLGAVVSIPLLGRSPIVGGELAPWPSGLLTFARSYLRPWEVGDLPAVVDANPGQLVLGLANVVTGGSSWLAPRVLLLAIVPVAWVSALRAGRLVTRRRLPRVAGASLYALSPPMLAALRTGRLGPAIAGALLPVAVIAAARAVLPDVPPDRAWRATAAASLLTAAVVAFEPTTIALVLVGAIAAAIGIVTTATDLVARLVRLLIGLLGAALLLVPWMPTPAPNADGAVAIASPLPRLLLLTPPLSGFPGVLVGLGLAVAALLGLALARRRVGAAAGLAAVYLAAVGVAWVAIRPGNGVDLWPGAPLLVAALAAAGLLIMAFTSAEETLAEHAFGWRQLATLAAGALVVVGVVAAGLSVAGDAWDGYGDDPAVLPAFLASEVDVPEIGPFRVLVLAADGGDARVRWTITDADGPTMASWGHVVDPEVTARIEAAADALARGQDPGAAARLGTLGVRYVVVPETGLTDDLDTRLTRQLDLVAQPVADGLVLRVTSWLPRWSVVPAEAGGDLDDAGVLDPADAVALDVRDDDDTGLLVLADAVGATPGWSISQDGDLLQPDVRGGVPTWELDAGPVEIVRTGEQRRAVLVTIQVLLLGLAVSLALRAPRFARRDPRSTTGGRP